MLKLSPPELRIIGRMLIEKFGEASPLLDGISSLKFENRHMTGTGYYINFLNSQDLPAINKLNTELSEDLRTTLPAPCDVAGFTLLIRDGYLASFEGYTFGDVGWPEEVMENWLTFKTA